LGYALWYLVLPQLGATRAAVAQTTVPVLVVIGGAILLGEIPDAAALLPGSVVLAGVLISLMPQRRIGSNRS
jgi:drug/metabolite transporter (DMT)-like permease